jgi:hypothetical protein
MTTTLDNLLDQALDIRGSVTQTDTRTFADEPAGLGAGLSGQTGAAASMAAAGGGQIVVTGLTGMTVASVGQFLTISGAAAGVNNDTFLIEAYTSATQVTISDNGTAPGNDASNGSLNWVERAPYSLEDDINFRRTHEQSIKGTTNWYDAMPTYDRPTAVGTLVDANLTNIADKTTDAIAFCLTRKFEDATAAASNTRITITDTSNLPHADAVDRTGVPIRDGADAGNLDCCFAEIIDPSTGTALVIDGRATGTITTPAAALLVDAETFVINDGTNPAVTFEFDNNASVAESNTLRAVVFAGTDDTDSMATKIAQKINGAPVLTVSAQVTGLGTASTGSLTTIATASLVDGETFVLDDGVNAAVTFEFDTNASVVESATLRAVTLAGGETADQVRDLILTAISNAPTLDITGSNGGAATVSLVNDRTGTHGDVTITDTVANAGFIPAGMTGGVDAIITLTETTGGTAGNQTITETVTDAAFAVTGMAGGLATHNHRVYGYTEAGGSTEPNSVEVAFYSDAIGDPISTSNPYTWTANDPTTIDIYYGFRDRLDQISDSGFRTTLTNGIIGDAGLSTEVSNLRSVIADGLGPTDTDLNGLLTNLTNWFPFSDLPDATPAVVEALNTLNEQIGDRDYSATAISNVAGLADGQTITASIEALALAIASSSVVRLIERLGADITAGTIHTIPGGNTYTLDGSDNGQNMWVFWRGVLRDPGPVGGGNDYDETSTTQITPYTKIKSGDHVNYMIYA